MKLIQLSRPVLTPWEGLSRLSNLSDEISRLFGAPLAEFAGPSNSWVPALDVLEDTDNYVVKAELPGMKKEDIDVTLKEGVLTITGERKSEVKPEAAEVYRAERYFGRFERSITLPSQVAAEKVTATYQDGVLTINVPKSEAAKPKKIDVAVN